MFEIKECSTHLVTSFLFLFSFVFKTVFLCVVLEFTLYTRLAWNSQRSACLCFPCAGVKGVHYHHRVFCFFGFLFVCFFVVVVVFKFCMAVCFCEHMCTCECRCPGTPKDMSDPLGMEFQVTVSPGMKVLGKEQRSSARAAGAADCHCPSSPTECGACLPRRYVLKSRNQLTGFRSPWITLSLTSARGF